MALNHTVQGSVNYTVVGSPTIVDGVVSGFSSDNYLSLPPVTWGTNPFEIKIKFTTGSTNITNTESLFSRKPEGVFPNFLVGILWSKAPFCIIGDKTIEGTTQLALNTTYYIKVVYDGKIMSLYLGDASENYNLEGTETGLSSATTGDTIQVGGPVSNYQLFDGSIDLNETYIKVNGAAWFGNCPVEVKHIDYGTSVGYTKVGSPTISNGVVSGFSNSDYLTLNGSYTESDLKNNFELFITFTTTGRSSLFAGLAGWDASPLVLINGSKQIVLFGTGISYYAFSTTLEDNTVYSFRFKTNNGNITADILNSSGAVIEAHTTTFTDATINTQTAIQFGRSADGAWDNCSIDLNSTYIKVNGKLWFFRPSTNYLVKDNKLVFADSGLYLSGPVNYTKVGSPNIVDGVLSNTTGADYVTTSSSLDLTSPFELVTRVNTSEEISRIMHCDSPQFMDVFAWPGQGVIMELPANTTTTAIPWNINTWYTLKITGDGTNITIAAKADNESAFVSRTATIPASYSSSSASVMFGRTYITSSEFPGNCQIDLNSTYIKVNGNLWFYGKNYASQNIAPVPSGYTYGNTTTSAIGFVDMRTQAFTGAPGGATIGRDE